MLYENKSYNNDLKRFNVTIVFVHWGKKNKLMKAFLICIRKSNFQDHYYV